MRAFREGLSVVGLVVIVVLVALGWVYLPARVPTHFGLSGPPDEFGAKGTLLLLPIAATGLYGLLSLISQTPEVFNYPVEVTKENASTLYALGAAAVGWLKAEVIWIFVWLTLATLRVGLTQSPGLSAAFTPATLGVVGLTVMLYWRRMLKVSRGE
jgi:hypothetical protein